MKRTKRFFGFMGRNFFNVRRWTSYDYLKNSAKDIYANGKEVFKGPKISKPETFSEAADRLGLSKEDLQERYNSCKTTFLMFFALTVALALYTLYLLFTGIFLGAVLTFSLTTLVGIHAFKYHFWMFQIKNKKLGCSLNEWRSGKTNNNKKDA